MEDKDKEREAPSVKFMKDKTAAIRKSMSVIDPNDLQPAGIQPTSQDLAVASKEIKSRLWITTTKEMEEDIINLRRNNEVLTKKCAAQATEIDVLKQVAEKKMLSYIRREDKMKAEIEELKILLEKERTNQEASENMGEARALHHKIQERIDAVQDYTTGLESELEQSILETFQTRLESVKQDITFQEKKALVAVKYEQRMLAMKDQLDWLRREAVQIDTQNQSLLEENKRLRIRTELDAGERKIINKEVVKLKKKNGYLQDEVMALTEKINEATSKAIAAKMEKRKEEGEGEGGGDKREVYERKEEGSGTARKPRPSSARSAPSTSRTYTSQPFTDESQNDQKEGQIQRLREVAQIQANTLKSTQRELARLQAQQTELHSFLVLCMEDVKAEKMAMEGAKGKKKDAGLSAEERNKVLVKLVSKERVLELLKETMGVTPRAGPGNATQSSDLQLEDGEVEQLENFGGEDQQVTRALPPRPASPAQSASPSPSQSPSPSPLPYSGTGPSLKANFLHYSPTNTKTLKQSRPSSAPHSRSAPKLSSSLSTYSPSVASTTITKSRPTTARPTSASRQSPRITFTSSDKLEEIMRIYHGKNG